MAQQIVSSTTFAFPDQPDITYHVARGPDPDADLPDNWVTVTPLHATELDADGNPLPAGDPIGFAGP